MNYKQEATLLNDYESHDFQHSTDFQHSPDFSEAHIVFICAHQQVIMISFIACIYRTKSKVVILAMSMLCCAFNFVIYVLLSQFNVLVHTI